MNMYFKSKKLYLIVVAVVLSLLTLNSSLYYVEGGEFVREQSPSGGSEWAITQGVHVKMPFFSRIDRFNQFITIDMSEGDDAESATVDRGAQNIKFSDTYTGVISTSWRFALPVDPVKLEKIYQSTKSQESLSQNTLLRYAQNLLVYTGNQFLGEDFMQGGQNEFLSRLYYQAQHGLYQTKRVKKLIETEASYVSKDDQEKGKGNKTAENFIWTVELQKDKNGNPLTAQDDNIISEFGVNLEMISIVGFNPDEDLQKFMSEKKRRIRDRSGLIEDQRNEREKAITAQLKGERERIEARADKMKIKDAAVIAEEQKVEVSKKQSELATVEKLKELEVAKANRAIQEANFESSKFEAQALKEKGLAEAKVSEAKYQALNNPVYLREIERDQAMALYQALPNIKVEMPQIVQSGDGKSSFGDNLGAWSSLGVLNQMGVSLPKQ